MVIDTSMTAEILEEALKSAAASGNSEDLMAEMMTSLGEIGITDGKMSKAYAVNPDRDDSYLEVYSTVNGVGSTILKVMAPKVLSKTVRSGPGIPPAMVGKRAFTLVRPNLPERTKMVCDLHPESAKRDWLDAHGLEGITCAKANIPSVYEVMRHRRITHRDEDALITKAENDERENEMRDYQKSVMAILAKQAEGVKVVKSS